MGQHVPKSMCRSPPLWVSSNVGLNQSLDQPIILAPNLDPLKPNGRYAGVRTSLGSPIIGSDSGRINFKDRSRANNYTELQTLSEVREKTKELPWQRRTVNRLSIGNKQDLLLKL
jgi:hypothetical protein